jgi:hypothetical protein
MILDNQQIASLFSICPDVNLKQEHNRQFLYLPKLKIPVGESIKVVDALLCPSEHSGYTTRLFLSEPISERPTISGKAANWTVHSILARTWHSWSWQGVSADLPLVQMLLAHTRALK